MALWPRIWGSRTSIRAIFSRCALESSLSGVSVPSLERQMLEVQSRPSRRRFGGLFGLEILLHHLLRDSVSMALLSLLADTRRRTISWVSYAAGS